MNENTFIRKDNALLDFALPGVFRTLFLTDLDPSELLFNATGVAKFFFCTDDTFNFSNGPLISVTGVPGANETDNVEVPLLAAIGLSGTSDSRSSSSSGFTGSKRTLLGVGEVSISGRNRLLT